MFPWEITAPWNRSDDTKQCLATIHALNGEDLQRYGKLIVAVHRRRAIRETAWTFVWCLVSLYYAVVIANAAESGAWDIVGMAYGVVTGMAVLTFCPRVRIWLLEPNP